MTAPKSRLKDPKVCRIFFSSPFNGMEGEREALTKLYWPRIQSLCSSKGIQFVPVDMRWGITSEMADNAQTINICLREADRSDMFVGFYGQRYGWFGAEDEALQRNFDVASAQYPWVDAYRDRSVTELEFLHGHLNDPGKLPAVICFRDKAFDDKLLAEAELKGDKRGIYKYSSESELATLRMDDLRKRVKESEGKCLAVHMSYTDPAEGAKQMFDAIWEHLNGVILKDVQTKTLSKRQSDLLLHNAFCDTHEGLYVGGEKKFNQLNQMISNAEKPVILITGEAGCGKSALLANWVKQRKEQTPTDSDDILIYHFVGSTNDSMNGKNILQRLIGDMEHMLNPNDEDRDDSYMKLVDATVWDLVQKLQEAMRQAVERQRHVILVVDGLNQVVKEGKITKPMYWCPPIFPRGVHIILSTQSSDTENIQELTSNYRCETLAVESLSENERTTICTETLLMRGKELSAEQLATLVAAENTTNPLYLKIVLEELCMFGKFRELLKKIESLVSCESAQELFGKYLERLEADYNTTEYGDNMVEDVMTALFISRKGLTETELTEMFEIPSHLWSPLYFSLEKYLINRQGFLAFVHDELRCAVESRYLMDPETRKAAYLDQIDFFWVTSEETEEVPFYYFTELPWLCHQAREKEQLQQLLCSLKVFDRLFTPVSKYELLSHWQYMETDQDTILDLLFKAIDIHMIRKYCQDMERWDEISNPATEGLYYLSVLGDFLEFAHLIKASERVLERTKRIYETNVRFDEEYREQHLVDTNYSLGCLYTEGGRYEQALQHHLSVKNYYEARIKTKGTDPDLLENLANACHGAGTAYHSLRMSDEAEEVFTKAIDIYKNHPNPETRKRIHNSQHMLAKVHSRQGKHELAVEELEQVLKVEDELYFGTLRPEMSYTLTHLGTIYRKLKQYDKAEEVYNRAMHIKVNALGEVHFDVGHAYLNLANLAKDREDWELFATYSAKAAEIYEKVDIAEGTEIFFAQDNLVLALVKQDKMDEAEPYFWKIFDYVIKKGKLDSAHTEVQSQFMLHFCRSKQYEKAKKVIVPQMSSRHCTNLHFRYLAHIDKKEADAGNTDKVQRPYEQSIKRGAELFPGDIDTVEDCAKKELIPARDLAAMNLLVEKYYAASEDQTEKLVLNLGSACARTGWNAGAVEFYEKWLSEKFETSESIYRGLAMQYQAVGDLPKCCHCLQRASELNPEAWDVMHALATAALKSVNIELAKETLAAMTEKWGEQEQVMSKIKDLQMFVAEYDALVQEEGSGSGGGKGEDNTEEHNDVKPEE